MADCPGCGSILKYDILSQKVVCTSCNNAYMPEEIDSTQMAEETSYMGVNEFLCPNCGGEVFSTDKDITGVCSYCGSGVVFASRLVQKKKPDLILPFKKTKEDCKKIYLEHVKGKHFIPKELKDPDYIDGFRGIYMPYWIADVSQTGNVRYYAKETRNSGNYIIEDTLRIKGELQASYHGLYHDAGNGFSDDISEKLDPFYLNEPGENRTYNLKKFYPSYLSGFYSEPSDVDFEEYEEYFLDIADRQTEVYLNSHPILKNAKVKAIDAAQYQRLDMRKPTSDYVTLSNLVYNEDTKKVNKKLLKEQKEANAELERELKVAMAQKAEEDRQNGIGKKKKDEMTTAEKYSYQTTQDKSLGMFPVWFMSWRKKDRVAYLTVNGQTGRVVADLPIDLKQFFKIFALWFAVCFAVFSLFTIRSYAMPVYAVWFAGLVLHMAYAELGVIREHSLAQIVHKKRKNVFGSADIGIAGLVIMILFVLGSVVIQRFFNELNFLGEHASLCAFASVGMIYALVMTGFCVTAWVSIQGKERTVPVFLLSTIAAVGGTILVYSGTASDLFMYAAASGVFVCVAVTMMSLILQFNKVSTRPLPQFEHQGGDDRA